MCLLTLKMSRGEFNWIIYSTLTATAHLWGLTLIVSAVDQLIWESEKKKLVAYGNRLAYFSGSFFLGSFWVEMSDRKVCRNDPACDIKISHLCFDRATSNDAINLEHLVPWRCGVSDLMNCGVKGKNVNLTELGHLRFANDGFFFRFDILASYDILMFNMENNVFF